jgi:DNA-binding NtrC family response regulator
MPLLMIGGDGETRAAVREAAARLRTRVQHVATLSEGLQRIAASRQRATVLAVGEVDPALVRRIAAEPNAGALLLVVHAPSLRTAVEAAAWGAADLLVPPVTADDVLRGLPSAATAAELVPLPEPAGEDELVGGSQALVEVFKTVGRVAPSDATVLVTGESGTGKELVARALHGASGRREGPFVAVNCAAIPEDLLESELFGHERGAFTGAVARKLGRFERAHGGTLFLDEIGDMSLVLQAKILRALQEREIERLGGEERIPLDVRVVAATHRDLQAMMAEGEFREDLFYRLAVVRLHLPPLRERRGDVRLLALHYAGLFARAHGRSVRGFTRDALEVLQAHPWPGNVRELRNVLERAVLLAGGGVLLPEHVQPAEGGGGASAAPAETLPGYSAQLSMAEVEALHIGQVLRAVDGHFGNAAEILQMHRNTVSRKAAEYGIG